MLNHLLQILCLIAMEKPHHNIAAAIHDEKVAIALAIVIATDGIFYLYFYHMIHIYVATIISCVCVYAGQSIKECTIC